MQSLAKEISIVCTVILLFNSIESKKILFNKIPDQPILSFQQKIVILDSSVSLSKYSVIGIPLQDLFTNDEALINNLNHSYIFVRTANLVLYIDMTNVKPGENQILFVADDFEGPNEDDISEFNRNQYSDGIRRIIETHDTKWIPYKPGTSQNPNPFDTDDHKISSIERI